MFVGHPVAVSQFDCDSLAFEYLKQLIQFGEIVRFGAKARRELKQECAEFTTAAQRIDFAKEAFGDCSFKMRKASSSKCCAT